MFGPALRRALPHTDIRQPISISTNIIHIRTFLRLTMNRLITMHTCSRIIHTLLYQPHSSQWSQRALAPHIDAVQSRIVCVWRQCISKQYQLTVQLRNACAGTQYISKRCHPTAQLRNVCAGGVCVNRRCDFHALE